MCQIAMRKKSEPLEDSIQPLVSKANSLPNKQLTAKTVLTVANKYMQYAFNLVSQDATMSPIKPSL